MMSFKKIRYALYAEHENYLVLFGLISICFLLHFFIALNYGTIGSDGTHYISLGKNIIELRQYKSSGSHFPDIIQPPLFPILIAISYVFTNDSIISGFFISSLFRALSIIPLFLIGGKIFNRTISLLASLLFIAYPLLFSLSLNILSESTFCFFFLLAIYLLFAFLQKPYSLNALILGLVIGFAYSTRAEGFLLLITFLVFLIIEREQNFGWQNKIKCLFYGLIGFLLIYLPLSLFIYNHSGKWMVCPKIRLGLIHQEIWDSLKSDPEFRSSSGTLKYEKSIFRYSPKTLDLQANELFFGREKSRVMGAGAVENSKGYSNSIKKNIPFGFFRLKRYFRNLYKVYKLTSYHILIPPLLIPMLILGLLTEPWSKDAWQRNYRLFIIIFVPSFLLSSHMDLRFMFTIIPILLFWCANGIIIFSEWAVNSLRSLHFDISPRSLNISVVCILLLSILPSWLLITKTTNEEMKGYKNEASFIESHVPKDAIMIARKPQSSYLANRKYRPLPYLNFDELVTYAKKFSKSAVLLCKEDEKLRPELSSQINELKDHLAADSGFKILTENDCSLLLFE